MKSELQIEEINDIMAIRKQERLVDDPRWKYGLPPTGNANYLTAGVICLDSAYDSPSCPLTEK